MAEDFSKKDRLLLEKQISNERGSFYTGEKFANDYLTVTTVTSKNINLTNGNVFVKICLEGREYVVLCGAVEYFHRDVRMKIIY